MNCYGCNYGQKDKNGDYIFAPGQKDHMSSGGCLDEVENILDLYLEIARKRVENYQVLDIFLKLIPHQINEDDFTYIMNYQPSLDDLRSYMLSLFNELLPDLSDYIQRDQSKDNANL